MTLVCKSILLFLDLEFISVEMRDGTDLYNE